MTEKHSISRQQAEIAFSHIQTPLFARKQEDRASATSALLAKRAGKR